MSIAHHHYTVRELLALDIDELWGLAPGLITLTYDNGEVKTHTVRRTIVSTYSWFISRLYPDIPIYPSDHIGDSHFSKMTNLNLCSKVLERWYDHYPDAHYSQIEEIWELVYLMANEVYNVLATRLGEYVTSINAIDIAEVLAHPKIAQYNEEIRQATYFGDNTIGDCIRKCFDVLLNDPDLDHNEFAISARARVVNLDQAMQIISPIGNRADIDSRMFSEPIRNGIGWGLTSLYESMLESRAASRATVFHEHALQSSETNNRLTQLVCASIENLHHGDCGSRDYLEFTLTEKRHLRDFEGQYYFDEAKAALVALKKTDTHLLNRKLPFRNVLTCHTADRYGVCATCYGQLSRAIAVGTNVGHSAPTVLIGFLSQLILSTKHLDRNAAAEILSMLSEALNYFSVSDDNRRIKLHPQYVGAKVKLLIPIDSIPELSSLRYTNDLTAIYVERFSSINSIELLISTGGESYDIHKIQLTKTARLSFTKDFLLYMKEVGWGLIDKSICVSLSDWDPNKHIMVLPILQFSSPEFMKQVTHFLTGAKSSKRAGKSKSSSQYSNLATMLLEFNDMVSMKLNVNVVHLSMIILGHKTVTDLKKIAYRDIDTRPPLPKMSGVITPQFNLLQNRSISTSWASLGQTDVVLDWQHYMPAVYPHHYQDWLFVKDERNYTGVQPPHRDT